MIVDIQKVFKLPFKKVIGRHKEAEMFSTEEQYLQLRLSKNCIFITNKTKIHYTWQTDSHNVFTDCGLIIHNALNDEENS